jgi:hypothetical protein
MRAWSVQDPLIVVHMDDARGAISLDLIRFNASVNPFRLHLVLTSGVN